MQQTFQQALTTAIISLKPQLQEGLTEYSLLKTLQKPPYSLISDNALRDNLAMFRCHFILFNSLYQLRNKWLQEKQGVLSIHTTRIHLVPYCAAEEGITIKDPLQAYYLDWKNFTDTDKQDVNALIDGFWRQIAGEKRISDDHVVSTEQARKILQIQESVNLSLPLIKRQYKKLQHQFHPDKGGSEEEAKTLSWAYQTLRAHISQ